MLAMAAWSSFISSLLMGSPTLRLSGVYLAMATLAFGEVVRIFVLNTESWTGGALGLNGIPPLTQWWHVALALVLACGVLALMRRSKVGRAFEAIKLDETAAGLIRHRPTTSMTSTRGNGAPRVALARGRWIWTTSSRLRTAAGGSIQRRPWSSSGSCRKNGEAAASGWIAEQ